MDSKYHFDIVKAIGKIDKERVGKPFMILELENDTTLKAGYPMHDVREILNRSSDGRVFFPDTFKLTSIEGALDALY